MSDTKRKRCRYCGKKSHLSFCDNYCHTMFYHRRRKPLPDSLKCPDCGKDFKPSRVNSPACPKCLTKRRKRIKVPT